MRPVRIPRRAAVPLAHRWLSRAQSRSLLIDPRSAPILKGSILEFNDSMLGGGLKVYNPQAVHECSCGKSFAI